MSPVLFLKAIVKTLKNRNYLILVIGFFFFMITSGIFDQLEVFMFTYFWELQADQIRWFGLTGAIAAISGAIVSPILMRKFDRKPVMMTSLIGTVIFAQLMVGLRLLGFMFENGNPALLPLLLANRAGFSFSLGVGVVVILSMIGDVIDDTRTGCGPGGDGTRITPAQSVAKAESLIQHLSIVIHSSLVIIRHKLWIPMDLMAFQIL